MQLVPIPTISASASVDGLKPLVGGEVAISDVFHQLLISIQALQPKVSGEASAEDEALLEVTVDDDAKSDEESGDADVVAVNLDAPKGLLSALEAVKAAIESQKELATLAQQAKAGEGESKASGAKSADAMSPRIAMQKLDELLLGYSQSTEGEETPEDGETSRSQKPVTLGDLIKPLALESEVGALAKETALEPLRGSVPKLEAHQLTPPSSAASLETGAVKESQETAETKQSSRSLEPPTIRTVGDFTVRSVRHLLGSKQESIQIRLVPRSLGELHISVTTVHDKIEVTVTAASGLVRDVLDAQLAGLKDSLSRDGVEVSRISVNHSSLANLGGHFAQAHSHAAHRHAQPGHAAPLPLNAEEAGELSQETAGAVSAGRGMSHDGDLDMRA